MPTGHSNGLRKKGKMFMFKGRDLIKIGVLVFIILSLFICNSYAQAPGPEEEALKKGIDYSKQFTLGEKIPKSPCR